MRGHAISETPVGALAGFVIWFAHFGVVYGINGLACARGYGSGGADGAAWLPHGLPTVPAAIGLVTLAALVPLLWLLGEALFGRRRDTTPEGEPPRHFLRRFTALAAAAGLIAVAWTVLPVLDVPSCA